MSIVTSTRKSFGLAIADHGDLAISSSNSIASSKFLRGLGIDSPNPAQKSQNRYSTSLVFPNSKELPDSGTAAEKDSSGLSVDSLMQALPAGVVVLDSQGRIQDSNPAANELLGALTVGQFWRDLIVKKFEPRFDDGHEVSLKSGQRVSLTTRSLQGDGGQLIVLNDLTETRKLQTQLSRHQRLSAMGKMMSSLAHQIRTPLSAALLHADNLVSRSYPGDNGDKAGQKIISRLRNIERQIRDMLVFAKGGSTETTQIAPSILIEHMRESARDLADHYGADILWSDQGGSAELHCNLDGLIGAFLNLLENAFQASGDKPCVTVKICLENSKLNPNENFLSIEVVDQGGGIDPSILESLTVPFSTTKANGNGLGLAIVRLVCQSHGGQFSLTDHGQGVSAKMLIPVILPGVHS